MIPNPVSHEPATGLWVWYSDVEGRGTRGGRRRDSKSIRIYEWGTPPNNEEDHPSSEQRPESK